MSLAEELLADFETIEENERKGDADATEQMDVDGLETKVKTKTKSNAETEVVPNRIGSLAKLKDSSLFGETMSKIGFYQSHQRVSQMEIEGVVEHDPEYLLIVDANRILVEIDNEIDLIHNFVKTIYRQRFPELEQLVQLSLDYLRTVHELANHVKQAKMNENSAKFLPPATIMIVSVSASTTQG